VWTEYQAEMDDGFIPPTEWGKDHWSTLAYLEYRTVDDGGKIDNRKMRVDPRLHREFATDMQIRLGGKYPTILKDGQREGHDDWSCLEDMVIAGLLRAWWKETTSRRVFDCCVARVELTDYGRIVAHALRQHKAAGGNFADFQLPI